MKHERPCILIYNPVSGHGHLDSWNAIFVSLLLDKGWRVLALTPDAGALLSRLCQRGAGESPDFQVLDWNALPVGMDRATMAATLRALWRRWDAFGDRFFYQRPGSETTSDMPLLIYWRTRAYQIAVPFLFRGSHFLYARYRLLREWYIQYCRQRTSRQPDAECADPEAGYFEPVEIAGRINAALRQARWTPSIVFNMYMDTYRTAADRWKRFEAVNSFPWAGIRFVPSELPTEGYYGLASLRGMCFLDENVCRTYNNRLSGKHFEYLPDITETALPERPSELSEEIRRRAAGRKIVFLGGSIGGQKNLARWCELIGLADPRDWYFVQVGELHRGTFTAEDATAFDRLLAASPENLFLSVEYLDDERTFNDIIARSDILFAVYRDFRISSNMLCKAASFEKPILVSNRYLLGQRVAHYGIGRAVDENDASNMLEGLYDLVRNPVPTDNFAEFRAAFSVEGFAGRLDRFLCKCIHP